MYGFLVEGNVSLYTVIHKNVRKNPNTSTGLRVIVTEKLVKDKILPIYFEILI